MGDLNPNDLDPLENPQDILNLYQGAGDQAMIGAEIELAFFDSKDYSPMTAAQHKAVKHEALKEKPGPWLKTEPSAELMEIVSDPHIPQNLQDCFDELNQKQNLLLKHIYSQGLQRSYFQNLPDKCFDTLLKNAVNQERYNAFWQPPRDDMIETARIFFIRKSGHVSISYKTTDHLLNTARRLSFLTPFFFLLTDNSAPFKEGKKVSGLKVKSREDEMWDRGGISPYIFAAENAEDLIDKHIHHVMNKRLFVYYDDRGKMISLPTGETTSFNDLREKGLNTTVNYNLAESITWRDVKIAALRNELDSVTGHRLEARMFGVGLHQHQSSLLIMQALTFDEGFGERIDALLHDFGLQNTAEGLAYLDKAYTDIANHNGKFLEIPYGSGSMIDFAHKFGMILEQAYTGAGYDNALTPLLTICKTGWTDSKVNWALFDTLDKVKDQQMSFDPEHYKNPNLSAYLLYRSQLDKDSVMQAYA